MEHVSANIGFLRVLEEDNGFFQKVELRLLNSLVNNNNWQYLNLEQHRALFAKKPILVAYVGKKIGDGHNFRLVKTKAGEEEASFMDATAERIVGYFDDEKDIRIEEIDGVKWIVGTGYIWKWYAQELVKKLKEQGLEGMSVSIETLVYEMHKDGTTEVYTKYQILGTTILGDDVDPAVSGANIRTLSHLGQDGICEMTLRVASAQKQDNSQKTNQKGDKNMDRIFDIEDLRAKFAGYTVLAVNGMNVALLSEKGKTFGYTFNDGEDTVIPERIKGVAVNSVFAINGEDVEVATDALIAVMREKLNATQAELDAATERANTLQETLTAMEKREHDRRIEVIKNAIKDQLAKNNEGRPCALEEAICADLECDECYEEYANKCNKDGEWVGENEIRKEVDARCMSEIRKIEKANAEIKANAAKKQYSWDLAHGTTEGEDEISAILRKSNHE